MDKIEKLAQAWGCDLSDVLRRAVREMLARQGILSDEENQLLTSKAFQRQGSRGDLLFLYRGKTGSYTVLEGVQKLLEGRLILYDHLNHLLSIPRLKKKEAEVSERLANVIYIRQAEM
jgi:hypothetical protein